MKKILRYSSILISFVFMLSGCQKNSDFSEETSNKTNITTEITISPDEKIFPTDKILKWAVPDIYSLSIYNLNLFNKALKDIGADFSVDFVLLSNEEYDKALNKNVDIASVGFYSDVYKSVELIRSGFFRPIDDFLNNEKKLLERYSTKQWKSVSLDGKIYTIPNIAAKDFELAYAFNNEYFTKEQIENFDMSLQSLSAMIGEPSKKDNFSDILYLLSGFGLSAVSGAVSTDGLVFSEKTASTETIFSDKDCVDFLRTFNEYYKKGYINYNLNLFRDTLERSEKMLKAGNFKVCIVKGSQLTGYLNKDETSASVTIRSTRPIIHSRLSASTGITTSSKYQNEAFKLLSLVYTNPDILKYLVLDDPEDEKSANYLSEMVIGSDYFSLSADIKEFYDNNVDESVFLGFNADYSEFKDKVDEITKICTDNIDIWKSENFEEELNRVKTLLTEAGADEVLSKVNEQIKNYRG